MKKSLRKYLRSTLEELFNEYHRLYCNDSAETYTDLMNVVLKKWGWKCTVNADYMALTDSDGLVYILGEPDVGEFKSYATVDNVQELTETILDKIDSKA